MEPYRPYWGKARPATPADVPYHPLAYHSLDVAAVGAVLLERYPALQARLATLTGLSESIATAWLAFFLALHDLGKFAEGFQALQPPDLYRRLRGRPSRRRYTVRHDSLGDVLWRDHLWLFAWEEDWFGLGPPAGHPEEREDWAAVFEGWVLACTGHHGRPPTRRDGSGPLRAGRHFDVEEREAASVFARELRTFLLPPGGKHPGAPRELGERICRASWLIAGLAVLCDWLGSNQAHFQYRTEPQSLAHYWEECARPQAAAALAAAGLLPAPVADFGGARKFLPSGCAPTALQQHAESVATGEGPQLFLLEDLTGAGKTEAALILAHRLMAAGLADGLYLALPTMATADQMYERMATAYDHLYASGTRPSLILAHSARALSDQFHESVLAESGTLPLEPGSYNPAGPHDDPDEPAGARCAAWLADNAKKALLAHVGVGTLDQALLGVLPTQHQSLRLLGLARKVLVVDEVHAYDAYTHALVQVLLRFHAALGGSAVLLSATLPQRMRRELLRAFDEGRSAPGTRSGIVPSEQHYPLATQLVASTLSETRVAPRADLSRRVEVRLFHTMDEAASHVLDAVRAGRCVCWLRNTVADAIHAYERLRLELGDRADLFHARFAMGDRLAIQTRALAAFGKDSTAAQRRGRVLVATQVVEQSLDLDFDTMVTDLAPMDRLMQRAGRVLRHPRDAKGNRLAPPGASDERGTPTLAVLAPDPVDDPGPDWYAEAFPIAQWVYPSHGQLWLTARLLVERGGWTLPDDARPLIEGVFGEQAVEIPQGLQARDNKAFGAAQADRSLAEENALELEQGYRPTFRHWVDEEHTPTRLGERTATVYLARRQADRYIPWCDHPRHPWAMSRLSVPRRWIAEVPEPEQPALRSALAGCREQLPDKGRWSSLIPLEQAQNCTWQGEACDASGRAIAVHYDDTLGFRIGGISEE